MIIAYTAMQIRQKKTDTIVFSVNHPSYWLDWHPVENIRFKRTQQLKEIKHSLPNNLLSTGVPVTGVKKIARRRKWHSTWKRLRTCIIYKDCTWPFVVLPSLGSPAGQEHWSKSRNRGNLGRRWQRQRPPLALEHRHRVVIIASVDWVLYVLNPIKDGCLLHYPEAPAW